MSFTTCIIGDSQGYYRRGCLGVDLRMRCTLPQTSAVLTSATLAPADSTADTEDHVPAFLFLDVLGHDHRTNRALSRSCGESESTKRGGTNSKHTRGASTATNGSTRQQSTDKRGVQGHTSSSRGEQLCGGSTAQLAKTHTTQLESQTHTCSGAPSAGTSSAPVKKSVSSMLGNPRSQQFYRCS